MDDFKIINSDNRRELRDYLRTHGVYVPKGRGILIADALYAVVKEGIPWPQEAKDDIQKSEIPIKKDVNENSTQDNMKDIKEETIADANTDDTNSKSPRRSNMGNLFKA